MFAFRKISKSPLEGSRIGPPGAASAHIGPEENTKGKEDDRWERGQITAKSEQPTRSQPEFVGSRVGAGVGTGVMPDTIRAYCEYSGSPGGPGGCSRTT